MMKTGKAAEAAVKRSVLRRLNVKNAEKEYYGADAVSIKQSDTDLCCACAGAVPGFEHDPAKTMIALANNLLAAGAVPVSATVQVLLPESTEEKQLQEDMSSIAAEAENYGMKIVGGHTQVTGQVLSPQYLLTGFGAIEPKNRKWAQPKLKAGQELVLTKWVGVGGTAALVHHHRVQLEKRYPFPILDAAAGLEKQMSVREEAELVRAFEIRNPSDNPIVMHDLSQGGIFGALWEIAERGRVGLEIDLKKIPIRQETVEICEFFDINPYEFYSAGALLIGTDDAELLVEELENAGIPAAIIGRATDQNDRVVWNGEECRHLDRPRQDQWYVKMQQNQR